MLRSMGRRCIESRCRVSRFRSLDLVRVGSVARGAIHETTRTNTNEPAVPEDLMKSILFGTLIVLFLTNVASAQQPDTAPTDSTQSAAHKYFTDTVLINQNGEKMRFYTDLLQGKTVIINTFFSTCQGTCLPMTQNLEKVQDALGDRLGKDVHMIS